MILPRNSPRISLMIASFVLLSTEARTELIEDLDDFSPTPITKPATAPSEPRPDKPLPANKTAPTPSRQESQEPADPKLNNRVKLKKSKAGVVKFWSKSLSGLRSPGSLMLEEDVVVTQDDIRLEADKATIYFEAKSREVREVHAVGSVKFSRVDPDTGQPIKAEGREAIFSNAKRLITMKGEPVLYRGEDIVRGKVIYYDLKNGWVKADRVEGVVQPATKKTGPSK